METQDKTKTYKLKIDCREHDLISLIKEKCNDLSYIEIETGALEIGDFVFMDGEKEIFIVERKKATDLAASIKDGRYKEQSYRLDGHSLHNHNIMFIIEGNLNGARLDKTTLMSSIFSLNHYQGFSVWKTNSVAETADFIINSFKYILKSKKDCFYNTTSLEQEHTINGDQSYVNVIKSNKKENVTPKNIGEIMLCQIPGVGAAAAIAVMNRFHSIVNLIADLQEQGDECLKSIEVEAANGKSKKLNKTSIANIIKYLDVN